MLTYSVLQLISQFFMHGKHIYLRPLLAEDSDAYFKWINDKELVLKNAQFKPISKSAHEKWFENIVLDNSIIIFSIIANQNHKLIGSCSLRNIDLNHHNAELQIRIGEIDYHGQGFGSEAIHLLIEYGFLKMNLKRIYLHVFSHNIAAIKAYRKCHFKQEGVLKKAAYINGEYIDVIVMAIINEQPLHISSEGRRDNALSELQ